MEKYIKLENLGNGATSDVILVKNLHDKKLYALKRIFIEKDEKNNLKIKNEISILESLDHPNVIKYSESFEHNKKFCIVMENADKGDISHLIKKHKLTNSYIEEETLWNIFFQVSEAMMFIHSKKIIHRDIKSQNIFITKNGLFKLGDFGISKTLENTTDFAKSFLGTPYFLSPEICAGSMYNYKSDIWMLGCVLYECSSLKKPFSGETFLVLMQNIINKNFDPIPDIYSENFKEIINLLLEKDPLKRPMIANILSYNNFMKDKFKIYEENKKKLENMCKCDKLQNFHNSQILNGNDEIKSVKSNYSTSNNKSFDFIENNKFNNSSNSTQINENSVLKTPKKITLRKSCNQEFEQNINHQNNFNNFITNSEKKKTRKASMGNFHQNYKNKEINKEFLDSEKPFKREPSIKASIVFVESQSISPINKKLVKKNQIIEFEYPEETYKYMKLINFLKRKIGSDKTNSLINVINFKNNESIKFSLFNNQEIVKEILGSDYGIVVTLIREILIQTDNLDEISSNQEFKKDEVIKKHKKTLSLGVMNLKQKI